MKGKIFNEKVPCRLGVRCKLCKNISCLFCIDSILNKFLVQSRGDCWYQLYEKYRDELFSLKENGVKRRILLGEFCNKCEFKNNVNKIHSTVCYPDEVDVGDEYDLEDDLFIDNLDEIDDEDEVDETVQITNALASTHVSTQPINKGLGSGQCNVVRLRKKLKRKECDVGVSVTNEVGLYL